MLPKDSRHITTQVSARAAPGTEELVGVSGEAFVGFLQEGRAEM